MLRIAIADDEEFVLESIKERILSASLDASIVGFARNGAEAFEFLKKKKPDVFLVDINMPTMDGISFIQKVREQLPEIPTKFVVISGYDDFAYLQRAIQLGVSDYIRKPIVQKELLGILDKLEAQTIAEKKGLLKYRCRFYHEFRESLGEQDRGTLLACYGENVLSCTDQLLLEARILFGTPGGGEDSVKMVVWPEIGNVIGIFLKDVALHMDKLQEFAREAQVRLPLKYFYMEASGRDMDGAVQAIEEDMNLRFFDSSLRYRECSIKKRVKKLDFQDFEITLSHKNTEEAVRLARELLGSCCQSREEIFLLAKCYRQINVILMNQLLKNGIAVPEALQRGLMRFSLSRFRKQEELSESVEEQIAYVVDKVRQLTMKSELIDNILQYLQEHFQENITLNSLSEYFFVTPTYLSKKFKEKSSIGLSQYLENLRIDAAKRMLGISDAPVADIATEVGYPDSNYFSRVFKKATGLTPSDYRGSVKK